MSVHPAFHRRGIHRELHHLLRRMPIARSFCRRHRRENAEAGGCRHATGGEAGPAWLHVHQRFLQFRHQLSRHSPRLHQPPSRPQGTSPHADSQRHPAERNDARPALCRGVRTMRQEGSGEIHRCGSRPHGRGRQNRGGREILFPRQSDLHQESRLQHTPR